MGYAPDPICEKKNEKHEQKIGTDFPVFLALGISFASTELNVG